MVKAALIMGCKIELVEIDEMNWLVCGYYGCYLPLQWVDAIPIFYFFLLIQHKSVK